MDVMRMTARQKTDKRKTKHLYRKKDYERKKEHNLRLLRKMEKNKEEKKDKERGRTQNPFQINFPSFCYT
jgi:hypothetical protein